MGNILPVINNIFQGIPTWVRKNRILVWSLFILVTVFFVAGLGKVKLDNSIESFFEDDDPVKIAYDRYRATFGSDEVLYIVYKAKDGNIFSPASLKAVKGIQEELEGSYTKKGSPADTALSHITDITTIVNVSYLEADEGSLISRDFVSEIPSDKFESEKLQSLALNHPDYPLLLVSKNAEYGGIIIRTDFNARILENSESSNEAEDISSFDFEEMASSSEDELPEFETTMMPDYVPFLNAVRAITDKAEYSSQFEYYYAGNPESMGFIADVMMKEMGLIILGSILLIMLVLLFLFRSVGAVIWPILIVIFSILWMMGTIGWTGIPTGDTVNIIIFLLIAVGVSDSIHILSGYMYFRRNGYDHQESVVQVYKKSAFACFLTSLTTAGGMYAMTFVSIVSMQRFGLFAAAGVIYAFMITVIMLPLMMDLLKPVPRKSAVQKNNPFMQNLLSKLDKASARSPLLISIIFLVFTVIFVSGLGFIIVDSNIITIIKEDQPIRKAYDVVDRYMAGTGNIEIYFDTGEVDGLKDPEVLQALDSFQQIISEKYSDIIYKTVSLVNFTKDAYRVLNDGKMSNYLIPDDTQVLAQTLFLFETANPEDRRLMVSDDYRKARITINTRNMGSLEGRAFLNEIKHEADGQFAGIKTKYPDLTYNYTGQLPLIINMMSHMSWAQIQSFSIALAIISVILLIVFGSLRTGLISILPNIFPIVTVIGLMGLLRIPLDMHTLLVLPIIIGIAVDDTIHFLTNFRLEYKKNGNLDSAISKAIKEVGQAIIFTSLVLSVGYLIFLIAVNKGFGYFGILSSIAILTATLADLLLLPSLLRLFYRSKSKAEVESKISEVLIPEEVHNA